jgi:type IV pilus assembly protein PilB
MFSTATTMNLLRSDSLSDQPTGLALNLNWVPLGTLLTNAGVITPEQLEQALAVKEQSGQRLGEIIVEQGFAEERQIAAALAKQYNLELLDLHEIELDQEAVKLLPEALARRFEALPIRRLPNGELLLAVTDPTNLRTADDLRLALGTNLRLAVADPAQMHLTLARAYRRKIEIGESGTAGDGGGENQIDDIRDMATSVPTINVVNSLLTEALEEGASDVHVEPQRDRLLVRARIDGVTRELVSLPKHMQAAVTSRFKIMGQLDIAERRLPQDGRVSVKFDGEPLDLRIAVLPTTHGEQIVVRLFGRRDQRPTLEDLGMSDNDLHHFSNAIEQPYGAVLVVGPTGSGKTTTLYGALDHLNAPERVVMTVEDPVECQIEGVNQIEVEVKAGLTFARGLRTILRSDPDVLLVGEIRDEETAKIAVQAAMTGHLLLSTLHAQTAAAAVARLRDMGVKPSLLAASLNALVAQRLARRLCTECRVPHEVDAADLNAPKVVSEGRVTVYKAGGCGRCANTGYRGRVAIREVMPVVGEVRSALEDTTEAIHAAAVRQGMTTLREDGIRLCLDGVLSLEEIRRVAGDRID